MRIFTDLEEKNLYLIRITQVGFYIVMSYVQEFEQANDSIRETKLEMEQSYVNMIDDMKKKKIALERQITEKIAKMNELEKLKNASISNALCNLHLTVEEEVDSVTETLEKAIKEATGNLNAKKKPLELLTNIEKTIESQIRTILNDFDKPTREIAITKLNENTKRENAESDKEAMRLLSNCSTGGWSNVIRRRES